jgi:hypothetical protein
VPTTADESEQQQLTGKGGWVMSSVRVLVGTKKGAFVLSAEAKRKDWTVSGPFFAGWEIYHMKGSPVNPDRIYASQSSGWFGQVIQRSEPCRLASQTQQQVHL